LADTADISDQFRLDGKAALVTGAGKGIGRGIALTFAKAGADLALVARTKEDLDTVAEAIRSLGRNAAAIPADVTDIEGLGDVVERAAGALGGLNILVNNAGGVEQLGTYMDMTVAILENAFRFNVSAPFELGRHAVPHMLDRGGGAIVNIGSMSGMQNERGFLPYSLAKSALAKFTQLAAVELAPRVRVNAILPGCVETEALRGFMDAMPDVRAGLESKTPMRRNGTPDDIGSAALFFASPASSWITGKLLEVDGAAPAGLFPNEEPDL
jgi:7-alpha-hydroxysteroid dehydrogenase